MIFHRFFIATIAALAISDAACKDNNQDLTEPDATIAPIVTPAPKDGVPETCLTTIGVYEQDLLEKTSAFESLNAFYQDDLESLAAVQKFQSSWEGGDCSKFVGMDAKEASEKLFFEIHRRECIKHKIVHVPQKVLNDLKSLSQAGNKKAAQYWLLISFCNEATADLPDPNKEDKDQENSGTSL